MAQTARTPAALLSSGFILFYYSETMFWARPARAPILDLTLTWLAYSVLAGVLLSALATFRVRSLAALFLSGALYGWLSEGVLAGTLYESLPIQISWTGLAWHDLLGVCLGWYGLSRALTHSTKRALLLAAGLGVFWGAWAVTWWQPQESGFVTPLPVFALHVFTQGGFLTLAFAVFPRVFLPVAFLSRWGRAVLIAIVVAWFALVIVPQQPLALLIAPPLFALTLFALSRTRVQKGTSSDILSLLSQPLPWSRYLAILVMPGCAVLTYALFVLGGQSVSTNQVIFWVLTPLGFALYAISLWMVFRTTKQ